MKIIIDARWIFEELTGIGTYTQELIRHLAKIDRENEYVLLFDNEKVLQRTRLAAGLEGAANFEHTLLTYGPFALRGQWTMKGLLEELGADVFHSTNYMIPLSAFPKDRERRARCVVTIHDLIPLLFPEWTPKARKTRLYPVYRRLMRQVGARADVIICPSESSRKDVLSTLEIPPERRARVVVIPEGVDPRYRPAPKTERDEKVVLYVGRLDPYKNVPRLVEALAELRRHALPGARLKIIGPHDPRYPEADEKARELGVTDAITWCGYLGGDELVRAYQEADVFALPSDCEGFGLPVLEAMACGTPVVCSNRSSLPEVAGEAALMVNPDDPSELAGALRRVLTDKAFAEELRRKGLAQASKFPWARTAEETLKAYQLALS